MFKSVELRQNSRIIDKYVGMNVIILKVLCKIYPILLNRYVEKLIAEFLVIGTELINYIFHFFLFLDICNHYSYYYIQNLVVDMN